MHRVGRVLLMVVMLSWHAVATAEDAAFAEVRAALSGRDYALAKTLLETLHEQGDARATFYLSLMYRKGLGVSVNPSRAFRLLEQAAEGGDPRAQYNLGNEYFRDGSDDGAAKAAMWWQKAAEHGLVEAQHNLGSLYALGRGVRQDLKQARHWYRLASRNGSVRSAKALAAISAGQETTPATGPAETVSPAPAAAPETASPSPTAPIAEAATAAPVPTPAPTPTPVPESPSAPEEPATTAQAQPEEASELPSWVVEPPEQEPLPQPEPLLAPEPAQEAVDESAPITVDADWLDTRGDEGFTLQLIASRDPDVLWKMAASRDWERPLLRYRIEGPGGEPLWALGYGLFADVDSARDADGELPESVRQTGPWPRSLASIREHLSE